jgi:hypothetical protein
MSDLVTLFEKVRAKSEVSSYAMPPQITMVFPEEMREPPKEELHSPLRSKFRRERWRLFQISVTRGDTLETELRCAIDSFQLEEYRGWLGRHSK